MVTYKCNDDEFTDTLLPEYEIYIHGNCLQVELTHEKNVEIDTKA